MHHTICYIINKLISTLTFYTIYLTIDWSPIILTFDSKLLTYPTPSQYTTRQTSTHLLQQISKPPAIITIPTHPWQLTSTYNPTISKPTRQLSHTSRLLSAIIYTINTLTISVNMSNTSFTITNHPIPTLTHLTSRTNTNPSNIHFTMNNGPNSLSCNVFLSEGFKLQ